MFEYITLTQLNKAFGAYGIRPEPRDYTDVLAEVDLLAVAC